jgi:hypothetical protein
MMKTVFPWFCLFVAAICPSNVLLAEDFSEPSSDEISAVSYEESMGAAVSSDSFDEPSSRQNASLLNRSQPRKTTWTADYRVKSMFDSHTTYQFGTSPDDPNQYAPLSKLTWPLDATWHGLRIGVERPKWRTHFEWLTPIASDSYGEMTDFDWSGPARDPASVSVSPTRWTDGQMLEFEGSFKLLDQLLNRPIEVWPVAGFRFQRFGFMAYDGLQAVNDGTMSDIPPVGYRWNEETISFNQQYYMGYVGGQLRTNWKFANGRSILLAFQGDWAGTSGYNVDHHISGYEADGVHRYTTESTSGGALHLAIVAEMALNCRFVFGIQADHTEIRTTGTHHWTESGARTTDEIWSNGVSVTSDQTSITAYLRAQF